MSRVVFCVEGKIFPIILQNRFTFSHVPSSPVLFIYCEIRCVVHDHDSIGNTILCIYFLFTVHSQYFSRFQIVLDCHVHDLSQFCTQK